MYLYRVASRTRLHPRRLEAYADGLVLEHIVDADYPDLFTTDNQGETTP